MIRQRLFICFSLLMLSVSQHILGNSKVDRKYAFQVLAAEDARIELSELPLKSLAYIQEDASIQLGPSGYLLLVHNTGKLLEFEGAQVISIAERAGLINKQLGIDSLSLNSTGFDWLFIARKVKRSRSAIGAVTCRPNPDVKFEKLTNQNVLSKSDPVLCSGIEKVIDFEEPITCTISNIFDEPLKQFVIEGSYVTLDFTSLRYEIDLFIVTLNDAADNSLKADIAIKLGEEFIHIPRACELNTVLEALEMAIYIERMGDIEHCPLKYYQLAAALADRPIYQELLEAAQLRLYCQ